MNAYNPPVRVPIEWDDDDGLPCMSERIRRSRAAVAMIGEADEILTRTCAIVDRVMPPIDARLGFDDPQGFVAASRYSGFRSELHRKVRERIAAKVRGGRS